MRDLKAAQGVSAKECAEIAAGLLRMADSTETADVEEDDSGQRYADKVNAPLSPAEIEALRAQLESGEFARYRRTGRRKQSGS